MNDICQHENCKLKIWHFGVQPYRFCIFHNTDFGPGQKEFDTYMNLIAGDEMVSIGNVYIPRDRAILLKDWLGRTNRPVIFGDCKFESEVLFKGCKYNSYVIFDEGSSRSRQNGCLEFEGCDFNATVRFEDPTLNVRFSSCHFEGSLTASADPDVHGRYVFLQSCEFDGKGKTCTCEGSCNFVFSMFTCKSRIEIGKYCQSVAINQARFDDAVMFVTGVGSKWSLTDIRFYENILIGGSGIDTPGPELEIDGVSRFGNATIAFRNINLGMYKIRSSDFVFQNCIFDNVGLKTQKRRYGFDDEFHHQGDKRILTRLRDCYTNMKLAYDSQANYKEGNNFHRGEMWAEWKLQRCKLPVALRPFRWFFSWHTWYQNISNFGQSWGRPLLWLFFVLLISSILYFEAGVARVGDDYLFADNAEQSVLRIRVFKAIEFAFGRIAGRFSPGSANYSSWFWADSTVQIISAVEIVLVVICVTFFLLALRRRFKR